MAAQEGWQQRSRGNTARADLEVKAVNALAGMSFDDDDTGKGYEKWKIPETPQLEAAALQYKKGAAKRDRSSKRAEAIRSPQGVGAERGVHQEPRNVAVHVASPQRSPTFRQPPAARSPSIVWAQEQKKRENRVSIVAFSTPPSVWLGNSSPLPLNEIREAHARWLGMVGNQRHSSMEQARGYVGVTHGHANAHAGAERGGRRLDKVAGVWGHKSDSKLLLDRGGMHAPHKGQRGSELGHDTREVGVAVGRPSQAPSQAEASLANMLNRKLRIVEKMADRHSKDLQKREAQDVAKYASQRSREARMVAYLDQHQTLAEDQAKRASLNRARHMEVTLRRERGEAKQAAMVKEKVLQSEIRSNEILHRVRDEHEMREKERQMRNYDNQMRRQFKYCENRLTMMHKMLEQRDDVRQGGDDADTHLVRHLARKSHDSASSTVQGNPDLWRAEGHVGHDLTRKIPQVLVCNL